MSKNNFNSDPAIDAAMENFSMDDFVMPATPVRGTLVKGTVFSIDPKMGAWIDFGGKSDALVPTDELGTAPLAVGQESAFFVLHMPEGDDDDSRGKQWTGPLFSAKRAQAWNSMQASLSERKTINVRVTRVARNGTGGVAGLNVVADDLHGFVPYSMLAVSGRQVDALLGTELSVKVVQVEPEKRKLIFNQREVVAEQAADTKRRRDELFASLKVGEIRTGKVVQLKEYGCFVDIGDGLHGLVHKSELCSDTKRPVTEAANIGDVVSVKVLRAETVGEKRQLALSIKQVRQSAFLNSVKVGDIVTGTVQRLTTFGCFVELSAEHGVDGLIHKSEYNSAVRNGRKVLTPSEPVRVRIIELDLEKNRVGLSLRDVQQTPTDNEPGSDTPAAN